MTLLPLVRIEGVGQDDYQRQAVTAAREWLAIGQGELDVGLEVPAPVPPAADHIGPDGRDSRITGPGQAVLQRMALVAPDGNRFAASR